jgi:hypothetical protein
MITVQNKPLIGVTDRFFYLDMVELGIHQSDDNLNTRKYTKKVIEDTLLSIADFRNRLITIKYILLDEGKKIKKVNKLSLDVNDITELRGYTWVMTAARYKELVKFTKKAFKNLAMCEETWVSIRNDFKTCKNADNTYVYNEDLRKLRLTLRADVYKILEKLETEF